MARHHNYIFSSSNNHTLSLAFGSSASNPTPGLSFPMGTGVVVIIILTVSIIFSFCYHWLKLGRNATPSLPPTPHSHEAQLSNHALEPIGDQKLLIKLETLPCPPLVYMAGETMPRFVALLRPYSDATSKQTREVDEEKEACGERTAMDLKFDIRLWYGREEGMGRGRNQKEISGIRPRGCLRPLTGVGFRKNLSVCCIRAHNESSFLSVSVYYTFEQLQGLFNARNNQ